MVFKRVKRKAILGYIGTGSLIAGIERNRPRVTASADKYAFGPSAEALERLQKTTPSQHLDLSQHHQLIADWNAGAARPAAGVKAGFARLKRKSGR